MLGETRPDLEIRLASIDDPKLLDEVFAGAVAVINCAGPFLDTAAPLISAALRARIHYLDVTAEQTATLAAFERFSEPARAAGVLILPSMAFYGGLGDLLATAAMDDWSHADEIRIAVGLDSWRPTQGTRRTGERNTYRRFVFSTGELQFLADPAPKAKWDFPLPFGTQSVVALPLAETIVISRHLRVPEVRAYMNLTPLEDLHDPNTPEPTAVDETGRSAQKFVMDVVVRQEKASRRAFARTRYLRYHGAVSGGGTRTASFKSQEGIGNCRSRRNLRCQRLLEVNHAERFLRRFPVIRVSNVDRAKLLKILTAAFRHGMAYLSYPNSGTGGESHG